MTEKTSQVISTLRYPLAVLVICCHASFFTPPSGTLFPEWESWNILMRIQLFVSEVLPHVAVPLFMLFSGLLLFRNGPLAGKDYLHQLVKRVRTLVVPYLIWSAACFAVAVCQGSVSCTFMHFMEGLWDTALWSPDQKFSIDLPGYPMSMPLWFIRDLIVLMILSYPIGKLLELTRGWILLLPALWWFPGHEKFFGFGADVLFYFSLGAWLSLSKIDFVKALGRVKIPSYVFAAAMLVVESLITFHIFSETHTVGFKWIPFNIFVVSMMAATINIASEIVGKGNGKALCALAPSSFFLYASHIVFLTQIQRFLYNLASPVSQTGNILFFFGFIIVYVSFLTALFFVMRRTMPKILGALTGGRN